jgi:hypothetical protein
MFEKFIENSLHVFRVIERRVFFEFLHFTSHSIRFSGDVDRRPQNRAKWSQELKVMGSGPEAFETRNTGAEINELVST